MMRFNDRQREAVESFGKPLLVLAGAGSGKTRCIIGKILSLISRGIPLRKILAFTFTNKAAKEMLERLKKEGYPTSDAKWVGTIHSICVRILRREKANFTICDEQDALRLVKEATTNLNYDPKVVLPSATASKISLAKMSMMMPDKSVPELKNKYVFLDEAETQIYAEYNDILQKCNLKDFDDLILDVVSMLRNSEQVRSKYRSLFDYVLVDEYQDINPVQDTLIKLLSGENLMVVGDDQQSIYAFRGSEPSYCINFNNQFPGSTMVKLEQNYRSTGRILDAANGIIAKAEEGIKKKLWAESDEGEKIKYVTLADDKKEAEYVRHTIQSLVTLNGSEYSDFAILYRTNKQAALFDIELSRVGIPHKVVNATSFFDRVEIRDMLAYLKFIENPKDVMSFKRAVSTPPRKFGSKSQERVIERANREFEGDLVRSLSSESMNAGWSFGQFSRLHAERKDDTTAEEILRDVIRETRYADYLKKKYGEKDGSHRASRLDILVDMTRNEALGDFLTDVALVNDSDNCDKDDNTVKLLTVHSAKGLEFNTVFVVGVEQGLMPFVSLAEDWRQYEEERRLFYVAVTRAEENLYLTRAIERTVYGKVVANPPSPFIDDIPEKLLTIRGEL